MMWLLSSVVLCVLIWLPLTGCSTESPPDDELCLHLVPWNSIASTQSSQGGFEILSNLSASNGVYMPENLYEIVLHQSNQSINSTNFITGFILQAVNASATGPIPIGNFSFDIDSSSGCFLNFTFFEYLDCSTEYPLATVTQAYNASSLCLSFFWIAPAVPGTVDFRYTVVGSFNDTAYGPFSLLDKEYVVPTSIAPESSEENMVASIEPSTTLSQSASEEMGLELTSLHSISFSMEVSPSLQTINEVLSTSSLLIDVMPGMSQTLQEPIIMTSTDTVTKSVISVLPTPTPNLPLQLTCPTFSTDNTTASAFQVRLGATGGRNYSFIAAENTNNRRFLDIKLRAIAQAWVAIGFSATSTMAEADVLACIVQGGSGGIAVVDAWNPLPNHTPTVVDSSQVGMCLHEATFIDGMISCSFSRFIDVIDVEQDVDLYDTLYQMYAYGDRTVSSGSISQDETEFGAFVAQHEDTPDISYSAISIVNNTGTFILPARELTKIHGVLMIFAWTMLTLWATFLSTWLRPALPRGEWMEFHQTFMIAATMLSAFGIVAIMVANYNNYTVAPGLISFSCGRSTGHFVLGVIVVFLQVTNLLVPVFRCQPNSKRRWIFTLLHGNVFGLSIVLIALTNVGMGIILYEVDCQDLHSLQRSSVLLVYVGFVVLQAVIQGIMFILFTISALKQKDQTEQMKLAPLFVKFFIMMFKSKNQSDEQELIEMKGLSQSKKSLKNQTIKVDLVASDDSKLRWACAFVFVPVSLIGPLLLAILVVTSPVGT